MDFIGNSKIAGKNFEYIFYISTESPWLKTSMSALSGTIEADLKEQFPNYKGAYNIEKVTHDIITLFEGGHILLVADFLNTTKTVKIAITTLKEKFKFTTNEKLHVISILNNAKRGCSTDKLREINIKKEKFKIKYFVDVELDETSKTDCEFCKLNIDYSSIEEDKTLRLKSYDFWELADKYRYEDEKVKPNLPGRKKIFVPIFSKWIEENAAFLAYKFDKFIEANKINTKLNFVIIFPDEPIKIAKKGSTLNNHASGLFAKKITEIFDATTIGIPRTVIDNITSKKLKLEELTGINDDWKKDIEGIPPNTDIIILDEFHKEGSTFTSIKSILEYLGNPAKCYFTLADFNPEKAKIYKEKDPKIDFYNLYEFNYH